MEQANATLINALMSAGLAASVSEAKRMAEEMIGTSQKVANDFKQKQTDNQMFGFARKTEPSREQPLPSPEKVTPSPTKELPPLATQDISIQASTTEMKQEPVASPVLESAPDSYSAAQFGNLTINQLTGTDEPAMQSSQNESTDAIQPQTAKEGPVQDSQLLNSPNPEPAPASSLQSGSSDLAGSSNSAWLSEQPEEQSSNSASSWAQETPATPQQPEQQPRPQPSVPVNGSLIDNALANTQAYRDQMNTQSTMSAPSSPSGLSSGIVSPSHSATSQQSSTPAPSSTPTAQGSLSSGIVAPPQAASSPDGVDLDDEQILPPQPPHHHEVPAPQVAAPPAPAPQPLQQSMPQQAMPQMSAPAPAPAAQQPTPPVQEPAPQEASKPKAQWTESEQKVREQTDITKIFNFSGGKR